MSLANNRFFDSNLVVKKILKSGTSFYIFEGNVYDTINSSFLGTRLY
jgi:hypothetical protein